MRSLPCLILRTYLVDWQAIIKDSEDPTSACIASPSDAGTSAVNTIAPDSAGGTFVHPLAVSEQPLFEAGSLNMLNLEAKGRVETAVS